MPHYKIGPSEQDRLKWIQGVNIRTVLDVGASEDYFALECHRIFPDAKIYCFEPLRDSFEKLNSILKKIPRAESFNFALGDKKERIAMYRNEYPDSSSIRKMKQLHKEAFSYTSKETAEDIEVDTLDTVAQGLTMEDAILLEIDTQGYEDKVIRGAVNTLRRIKIIIVETSFFELYEGQPLFSDMYESLVKYGFTYSGSWHQMESPLDGALLQQDSIFIRK